ncbi:RHS repeat domain-containing protein [Catelliglobosispora koreensis]|uniref:RHS repeat domain-containing protein n=1 Tax=Catelliglobosispora koreensis TaxID=129052 RepID=UPI000367EC44|nr:RHS repeat-associated core domain-containing protein [Catelliglobosispora koreensis]
MSSDEKRRPDRFAIKKRLPQWLRRGLPLALIASVLTPIAAVPTVTTLSAAPTTSANTFKVQGKVRPLDLSQGSKRDKLAPAAWPAPSVADIDLSKATGKQKAGQAPLWIEPAASAKDSGASVRVAILDRAKLPAAWQNGVVVQLSRTDGAKANSDFEMSMDYSGFASAFGGDWSGRLQYWALPECALTTPEVAGCQATPIESAKDRTQNKVSVDLSLAGTKAADSFSLSGAAAGGAMMVALAAGPSGDTGDFGATALQASSSWTAGGSSGDFSWSYPITLPPTLAGPAPELTLGYSSSAVDGRTLATNNQPSFVGQGFDYNPGSIERRYKSCAEDMGGTANNTVKTGDLCWGTDNAVLSLNGIGGELVKDATTGVWKVKSDTGAKVERLEGTVNGAWNNEYWKVTTPDGVQYFFGLNRLPGYTGTAPANTETNSALLVPVAGNNTGERCRQTAFKDSFCNQAWRWNLDYIVDPNGNTVSFWYNKHTNKYAKNIVAADDTVYDRDSVISRIAYGTDKRSGTDTVYTSAKAPMQVLFETGDRCLTTSCGTHDAVNWPDTPWDQECTGTSCDGKYTPVFFSTVRLKKITTQVVKAGSYSNVDSWEFTHDFPPTGSGTPKGLWLESIKRTGHVGTPIVMPEVNFDWVALENRVDTYNGTKPTMNWHRMSTIWTETGGKISVRYSDKQCVPGSNMPSAPHANTLRCYPVLFEEDDVTKTEYYHKYLVTEVYEADLTGGGTDKVTKYEYPGTPAWRFADDDGMSKDKFRTWSVFRGYDTVLTRIGAAGQETLSETKYLRGMHGSKDTPAGGLKDITVNASLGNEVVKDLDAVAGSKREETVYNGALTAPVSKTVYVPWVSAATASRNMGTTTVTAAHEGTQATYSSVKLEDGTWRTTKTTTVFDSYGMEDTVTDWGLVSPDGVTDASGDETCVDNTYNRNVGANILASISRVQKFAVKCGGAVLSKDDVIDDVRTSYDNQAYGAAPTKGIATMVEKLESWTPGGGTQFMVASRYEQDVYGREIKSWDIRNNVQTIEFTPTTGGPVTKVTTTNHKGWFFVDELEPAWGKPTGKVDVNNKRTDMVYDALGRLVKVWLPNRPIASNPASPSIEHIYTIRNAGGVNAVTTKKLNASGNYVESVALYDGLLRERQTQSPAATTGTVFTENIYDAAGRKKIVNNYYYDANVSPSTTLRGILDWENKSQSVTEYDRAGRAVATVFKVSGQEKWRTTISFGGDRIYTNPPAGGSPTTTISDARGNTVALRQHSGGSTAGPFDETVYTYNRKGQLEKVTDSANNVWKYTFDVQGRAETIDDPDKGLNTKTFYPTGDVKETIDARGEKLMFEYDDLGRKVAVYDDAISATNKRATWAYDPTGAKGHVASYSRWTGTNRDVEYKTRIRGYTPLYKSTGEDYIIPTQEAGLAGTYTFTRTYKVDGSPATVTYPNAGGLGGETVTYTYDSVTGRAKQVQTNWPGAGQYVTNTDYTAYGEVSFVQYQMTAGNWIQRSRIFEDSTRNLIQDTAIRQIAPQTLADVHYTFDATNNIKKIADTPAGGTADVQCFTQDHLRRLVAAWTPSSGNCDQAADANALGGPAPYYQSWVINKLGNRITQTDHAAGGNTVATSTYPNPGTGVDRPHAATTVTTTGTGAGTKQYAYDANGNMVCRPNATATSNNCTTEASSQILGWDAEDKLSTVEDGSVTHEYLYDAEGTRLIARDGTGKTLFLPQTDLRYTTSGGLAATRYYNDGLGVCAVRTAAGINWMISDHHNTQSLTVAAGNQAVTQRREKPFGGTRGTPAGSWPTTKGFVGGEKDATGLTYIGARAYDPAGGRFISVDPVIDYNDPQQMNGYAYSNNSPITMTDPTGKRHDDGGGGGGGSSNPCANPGSFRMAERCADEAAAARARAAALALGAKHRGMLRMEFFEDTSEFDARKVYKTNAIAPGQGVIMFRFFISDHTAAGGMLEGDGRGFTSDVHTKYRVAVVWDTETGEVSFTSTGSCVNLIGACPDQDPVNQGGSNYLETISMGTGENELFAKYTGLNSVLPCCSVDGTISIKFDSRGVTLQLKGDNYPDFEAYQYHPDGTISTLAQNKVTWPGTTGEMATAVYNSTRLSPQRNMTWTNGERTGCVNEATTANLCS